MVALAGTKVPDHASQPCIAVIIVCVTGKGDSEVQRTMMELLNQLDGFEANKAIKVPRQTVHCTTGAMLISVT